LVIHQFSIVIGLFLKYFYLKIYCINIFLFFKIYLSINLSKQFKNINLKKIIFLTNTQSAEPCYQAYSYILFQIDLQTESNNHVSKKKKITFRWGIILQRRHSCQWQVISPQSSLLMILLSEPAAIQIPITKLQKFLASDRQSDHTPPIFNHQIIEKKPSPTVAIHPHDTQSLQDPNVLQVYPNC
jgi:hypothetical protein